jgi:riboflavin kinase/FMN adenylyltransferase
MRLYHSLSSLARRGSHSPSVVAIGVFDGLHLGHQAILREAASIADARGASKVVFTFEPMPREYFAAGNPPPRLTCFRERFEMLAKHDVDEVFCPRFDTVRQLPADEFIDELLIRGLNVCAVVVGDDFRFGAGRDGTVSTLEAAGRRHGFEVRVVAPVLWQGRRVSSTAIRDALQRGDLAAARQMLGRDYSISGRVVEGLGLGRDFGFPTANVNLKRRLVPVDGIFAVRVGGLGEQLLEGVASVGTRPTIGRSEPLLEVFIFDFDDDIYGRQITVHFVSRLREERKFDDVETMKRQMHRDVAAARAALVA